jgi:hypothetical protein
MAHFAKVEDGIVTQVIVANSKVWCEENLGGTWVQTSYNTIAGEHTLGGTPLRKNYAGIGYTYDAELDAFYAPQPFESWTLNPETCTWVPPVPMPTDEKLYTWDEESLSWKEVVLNAN